jgi:hypothetical protein
MQTQMQYNVFAKRCATAPRSPNETRFSAEESSSSDDISLVDALREHSSE